MMEAERSHDLLWIDRETGKPGWSQKPKNKGQKASYILFLLLW